MKISEIAEGVNGSPFSGEPCVLFCNGKFYSGIFIKNLIRVI